MSVPEKSSSSLASAPAPMPVTSFAHSANSIAAISFVVLWSTGYLAGKLALAHGAPFTLLVVRFGLAALIFAVLALLARLPWPPLREALHSAVVGVFSLALQFGGVYAGIKLGASAGAAALVIGIMPLGVALLARALGDPVSKAQWLGFVLGLAGVLLVVADRVASENVGSMAYVALAIGLFGICIGTLYQKRHGSKVDLRIGLCIQHLAAVLLLLPLACWWEHFEFDGSAAFYLASAWLVLVNSVVTFALLFVLLRRGAATAVAALFYLVPPVTAAMSFVLLGEHLSLLKLAGFALAAIGVYLGTRR
jgi:drug/metabolite transporter (DMT)-like permease